MQNCPASQQLISILRPCSVTVLGQLSSFLWATKLPNQSAAHRCQPSSWVLDEVHTASQNVRMLERNKRNSESADAPSFLPQTSSGQTGGRPCPSPAPHIFRLLLQAWNYPQQHSKTVSFHVSRHMLPFCERLFQPVCQQTPVLPSRLSTCLFCPAGPLSSKSSLPALCNHLPADMLPSKSSLGFRNEGHAFCI